MSLDGTYETSKIGPTTGISFTASSATRIRLVAAGGGGTFKKKSFAIEVTQDVWILQGTDSVTVTATTGMSLLANVMRWRVDVEETGDAYISVLGQSASGTIRITKITEVATADAPAAV